MKKIVLILILITVSHSNLSACDICGCGIGNSYIGILPDFSKHIIGLRYRQNSMLTHLGVGGASSYLTTKETYRISELWAGWNIGSKLRLMGSVPYNFNERTNQGSELKKNGLGDVSVSTFYNFINKRKALGNKLVVQSLWLGAGIKAPTGRYNPFDKGNTTETANLFQLGTGSTDFLLNALYDLRVNDAGISASGSYKMNTQNRYEYRYGNKISLNAQLYYKLRIANTITIAPNAGAAIEAGTKDADRKLPVDISGGRLVMATAGIEISFKKISVGGNFQSPISQDLARGIVHAKDRMMVHVSFLL